MSLTMFLGCLLYVFGPLLAIFGFFVAKKSQNIILAMGASFVWTIAILLSSSWWMIVKPLRGVFPFIIPFSVLFQEISRYAIWKLYYMAYHQVEMFKEDASKPSGLSAAVSVGWGIGASMALILQAPSLFSALGPADLPATACPSVSVFHIQALVTLPLALIHILITIVLFDAYQRKAWFLIILATSLHLIASFATVSNQFICFLGVGIVWSIFAIAAVLAWRSLVSPMNVLIRRMA